MKLLIGASSSKIFHLKEFARNLEKENIETKVVFDADYADGFPNRKISKWFSSNKKFKKLLSEFEPDVIFVDRTKHFALEASKTDIPLVIHLRGDHWSELIMARETLYKSTSGKIAINKWEEIAEQVFDGSKMILPICKYLENIVKKKYPEKQVIVKPHPQSDFINNALEFIKEIEPGVKIIVETKYHLSIFRTYD